MIKTQSLLRCELGGEEGLCNVAWLPPSLGFVPCRSFMDYRTLLCASFISYFDVIVVMRSASRAILQSGSPAQFLHCRSATVVSVLFVNNEQYRAAILLT